MASIRVGFFEDFKGADTLLIDVDAEGLALLTNWIGGVKTSRRGIALEECPDVTREPRVDVRACCVPDDRGLLRTAEKLFVWERSEEGWTEIVDKLSAMLTGAGHQHLDGPNDDVQVMASIGEYGDDWWRRHGT